MVHTLNLKSIYFDLIWSGEKVLEGRLNDEKRKLINIGDEIIFNKQPNNDMTLRAVVEDKYFFKDFEEMAESLDKAELGFAKATKQEMIETYYSIYSRDIVEKYGVVIFRIKRV